MTEIQRLGDVLLQALEETKPLLEIIAISGGITRRDRRGYLHGRAGWIYLVRLCADPFRF
jgi:hypothetical protein